MKSKNSLTQIHSSKGTEAEYFIFLLAFLLKNDNLKSADFVEEPLVQILSKNSLNSFLITTSVFTDLILFDYDNFNEFIFIESKFGSSANFDKSEYEKLIHATENSSINKYKYLWIRNKINFSEKNTWNVKTKVNSNTNFYQYKSISNNDIPLNLINIKNPDSLAVKDMYHAIKSFDETNRIILLNFSEINKDIIKKIEQEANIKNWIKIHRDNKIMPTFDDLEEFLKFIKYKHKYFKKFNKFVRKNNILSGLLEKCYDENNFYDYFFVKIIHKKIVANVSYEEAIDELNKFDKNWIHYDVSSIEIAELKSMINKIVGG